LSPTLDLLSDLSYSRQKLFYHTIHEVLKGYSGSNNHITKYNELHDYLVFHDIHSTKYTENEFKAVEMIEEILPKLFGYRFVAALKLGIISFFIEENGNVNFQPIAFSRWLCQEMLNARRVKAINALDIKVYSRETIAGFFEQLLTSFIVFGHTTTFDVIGKGVRTLSMFAADYNSFISGLVDGVFHKPYNPLTRSKDYGTLTRVFLENYNSLLLPALAVRRNIDGKTAIMSGFARLFQTRFNPSIIQTLGMQMRMKVFQNNPDIISKSSVNYAILKTFEYLINPKRYIDPTAVFRSVYRGVTQSSSFTILPEHGWATIWSGKGLGTITLDYVTMAQFFGRDFSKIQPALYYTERNLQDNIAHVGYVQPLDVSSLLTSHFIEKIDHLYHKFYEILSKEYGDGQQLTVTFHQDTSHGIHDDSILSNTLSDDIKAKFNDLIINDANSLSITIQKQGNKILNAEEFRIFITDITFYLVMFNSIAMIQESNGKYGLIASQREMFTVDYIFQLGNVELSLTGQQILSAYRLEWNQNDEGRVVWNYGDCWPIYLFNDARALIKLFNIRFLVGRGTISKLRRL